ncbi:hypothetical protein TKK_0018346 [Trichogramma kaykai]
MKPNRMVNYAAKVKEETMDICCGENDDYDWKYYTSDTKKLQYFGFPQENTIEKYEEIQKFRPDHEIKVEFECKDVKHNMNLLVLDRVNEEIHQFQPNQEIKIEFEYKNEKPNLNLLVPDTVNNWFYRSDQYQNFATSCLTKIETGSTVEQEFLSNTIQTRNIDTACKFSAQAMNIYSSVKRDVPSSGVAIYIVHNGQGLHPYSRKPVLDNVPF